LLSLFSCRTERENCCNHSNIVINDVYLVEYENKSRYICIEGIPGESRVSKYLSISQIHEYEYAEHLIKIDFQHNIIDEDYIEIDTNALRTEIFEFGILQIGASTQKGKKKVNEKIKKVIKNISINYYKNRDLCYGNEELVNPIPIGLINIGATKFTKTNNRKILTIKLSRNDNKTIIETLFSNKDMFYKYMKDKDLIRFESMGNSQNILRTYILTDSKGIVKYANEWCGVGPIEERFECIYVNNNELQPSRRTHQR